MHARNLTLYVYIDVTFLEVLYIYLAHNELLLFHQPDPTKPAGRAACSGGGSVRKSSRAAGPYFAKRITRTGVKVTKPEDGESARFFLSTDCAHDTIFE